MLTVADIEPHINEAFDGQLVPHGFARVARRKWVRSTKTPIRELFVINSLKGGRFSPAWGFSTGLVPYRTTSGFKRQSTDKNSIMDLLVDPIDVTANVPKQTFSFITGFHSEIPLKPIQECAKHFGPLACADFDRVQDLHDFCQFFLRRERIRYKRLGFYTYVQHGLTSGFVMLFTGNVEGGLSQIRRFCDSWDLRFDDPVLTECIAHAQAYSA